MISGLSIISTGGAVLWEEQYETLRGDPINSAIREVLLEERAGTHNTERGQYRVHWRSDNDLGILYLALHNRVHNLPFVDDLLSDLKASVSPQLSHDAVRAGTPVDAKPQVTAILERMQRPADPAAPDTDTDTATPAAVSSNAAPSPSPSSAFQPARRQRAERMRGSKKRGNKGGGQDRRRGAFGYDPAVEQMLNHSKEEVGMTEGLVRPTGTSGSDGNAHQEEEVIVLEDAGGGDDDPSSDGDPDAGGKSKGSVWRIFDSLTGNRSLQQTDIEPVLASFRDILLNKNVAVEIADQLCQSVAANIQGRKMATFDTVRSRVRSALQEALRRILTPRREIDVLQEALAAREAQRPYTMVFVGVNGVGKSTNLAKVGKWLLSNGLSVMMAACDTFRSGAVEQLKTHAFALGVPLFHRGYGKDAASVAREAIAHAQREGIDVVLIDTAGRMQNNEPLMRGLSKLITVNRPDLVLFVGEALVGNDAVDQLHKFNQSLIDFSTETEPRLIDGIVLTKFDTIDDKVGAALSMVYKTGKPIVFVGVGQRYVDIKKFHVNTVIRSLLT
eukprot:gb/GECH01003431.1/.p1 GENE.gb/GECH01003431.1/~~gb/GECH01003431.1/.p1  ORF type:complete len:559 (+),score=132.54 gb/GECH01003431.1/:1-1677(+)